MANSQKNNYYDFQSITGHAHENLLVHLILIQMQSIFPFFCKLLLKQNFKKCHCCSIDLQVKKE